jgi:hypothetical protein
MMAIAARPDAVDKAYIVSSSRLKEDLRVAIGAVSRLPSVQDDPVGFIEAEKLT